MTILQTDAVSCKLCNQTLIQVCECLRSLDYESHFGLKHVDEHAHHIEVDRLRSLRRIAQNFEVDLLMPLQEWNEVSLDVRRI